MIAEALLRVRDTSKKSTIETLPSNCGVHCGDQGQLRAAEAAPTDDHAYSYRVICCAYGTCSGTNELSTYTPNNA